MLQAIRKSVWVGRNKTPGILHKLLIDIRKIAALRAFFLSLAVAVAAATVRPFGHNNKARRAQPKMLKIHLENFAEICLKFFCGNPFGQFCGNTFNKFSGKTI